MQADSITVRLDLAKDEELKLKHKLRTLGDTEQKMYRFGLADEDGELTEAGLREYIRFLYNEGFKLQEFWDDFEGLVDETSGIIG